MVLSQFAMFGAVMSVARITAERDLTFYHFRDYMKEFGKTYGTEDLLSREQIFTANLETMRAHNADPSKKYHMNVNAFSDETAVEFGARLTASAVLSSDHLIGTHVVERGRSYPDSLDWRDSTGVISPVKNQGGCGSCWAFAAVETLESHYAISAGEPAPVLSAQEIVSCAGNPDHCGGVGGCEGSTSELAFEYTVDHGLSAQMDYDYDGVTTACAARKLKPCVKNGGYIRVEDNDYAAHMDALQEGPLAIMMAANALQNYGGGILTECDCELNHAVQLIGYGSEGSLDYWLIRNSWGDDWGEDGYVRIQRFGSEQEPTCTDQNPQMGEACEGDDAPRTYTGLCGLLGATVYPTKVEGTGTECRAYNSTCPFEDPANIQDLIDWCGAPQSCGCSFPEGKDVGTFDCNCFISAKTCTGFKPGMPLLV